MTRRDPKSDPSSNLKVATHITNRNFIQNLLRSRFFPEIIQCAISSINKLVTEDVTGIQEMLGLRQTLLPKLSVSDAARSCARIYPTPRAVIGESPNFIGLGLSPAQKTGKLNAVISTGTRAGGLVDHSKWLAFKHQIAEVTEGRGSKV